MGLLEKAEKILQQNNTKQETVAHDSITEQPEGLYKRCITYIGTDNKKKTVADKADKSSVAPTSKDFTQAVTVQESLADPEEAPNLIRSFMCFESFTKQCHCERAIVVTVNSLEDDCTTPRIVLCKGFDFTTENRFMLPYSFLMGITDENPLCTLEGSDAIETCKGYVSSSEFRALQRVFIAKLPRIPAWFIVAQSALNTVTPDFSRVSSQIEAFAQQLTKYGMPISPFVPAAVLTNNEKQVQSLIKTAVMQHKKCLLLNLSVEAFLNSCLQLIPQHYEHSVFMEIAAHLKKAAGTENILHCISPSNLRIGIFSAGLTDGDLYLLQLNKSFARTAGGKSDLCLISSEIATNQTDILRFMTQE